MCVTNLFRPDVTGGSLHSRGSLYVHQPEGSDRHRCLLGRRSAKTAQVLGRLLPPGASCWPRGLRSSHLTARHLPGSEYQVPELRETYPDWSFRSLEFCSPVSRPARWPLSLCSSKDGDTHPNPVSAPCQNQRRRPPSRALKTSLALACGSVSLAPACIRSSVTRALLTQLLGPRWVAGGDFLPKALRLGEPEPSSSVLTVSITP